MLKCIYSKWTMFDLYNSLEVLKWSYWAMHQLQTVWCFREITNSFLKTSFHVPSVVFFCSSNAWRGISSCLFFIYVHKMLRRNVLAVVLCIDVSHLLNISKFTYCVHRAQQRQKYLEVYIYNSYIRTSWWLSSFKSNFPDRETAMVHSPLHYSELFKSYCTLYHLEFLF